MCACVCEIYFLDLEVSGGHIFSCSSDKSVKMYSVMVGLFQVLVYVCMYVCY